MNTALIDLTERLVPISDFSQGKASKIFTDVYENNTEYIVLKNNQPTAIVISVKEYKNIKDKLERLEKIFEGVENIRLQKMAEERDGNQSSFEEFVAGEGFSMEKIMKLAESVDIE